MLQRAKRVIICLVSVLMLLPIFIVRTNSMFNQTSVTDIKFMYNKMQTYEGLFLDRNGDFITTHGEDSKIAKALYPKSYANVIGYNTGSNSNLLRAKYERYLYTPEDYEDWLGANITLTIDNRLQELAYQLCLEDGSITILDNSTGQVLCYANKGPLELNLNESVDDYFDKCLQIPGSLYQRGLYEQESGGSTMKAVTLLSSLEATKGEITPLYEYYDSGYIKVGNSTVHNNLSIPYGLINHYDAMKYSSNCYFINMGLQIGGHQLLKTANELLFNQQVELDFGSFYSIYTLDTFTNQEVAANSYGQGTTTISPIHLNAILQCLINDGLMLKPYMVSSIDTASGFTNLYKGESEVIAQVEKEYADIVLDTLKTAAQKYGLQSRNYEELYAKTGTSECSDNKSIRTSIMVGTEDYSMVINCNNTSVQSNQLYSKAQTLIDCIDNLGIYTE